MSLADRVLDYLARAECREIDPWLRDDLRIAWLTVFYAQTYPHPFAFAHYQILGIHPERLQASLEARRRAQLGPLYDLVMQTTSLPPKKPAASVTGAANEHSHLGNETLHRRNR